MNTARKLIAATFALSVTLATTALIFSPVALASRAPVVTSGQKRSAAAPRHELNAPSRQHESVGVIR